MTDSQFTEEWFLELWVSVREAVSTRLFWGPTDFYPRVCLRRIIFDWPPVLAPWGTKLKLSPIMLLAITLCILTETWLKDLDSVCIGSLSVHGFLSKSFRRESDRPGIRTGGLLRDTSVASFVNGYENDSFEFSEWISLKTQFALLLLVGLSDYLENIAMCPERLVIAGNINF